MLNPNHLKPIHAVILNLNHLKPKLIKNYQSIHILNPNKLEIINTLYLTQINLKSTILYNLFISKSNLANIIYGLRRRTFYLTARNNSYLRRL